MSEAQTVLIGDLRALRQRITDEITMVRVNKDALGADYEGPAATRTQAALAGAITSMADARDRIMEAQAALAAATPSPGGVTP